MKFHKLTALLLSMIISCSLAGCAEQESADWLEDFEGFETLNADFTPAETEPSATEHISPRETLTIQSGTQKDFTDVVLNHDANKIYPIPLNDFLISGDSVQKFIFEFESSSAIGSYQGGCGISVDASCKAATDDYWYQSQDFTVQAEGNYVKVEWDVPADIQEHVNPDGKIQIGYWWGDAQEVSLKYVTCCYTRTAEIPVDDSVNIPVSQILNYSSDSSRTFPLADILGEDGVPQAVTVNLQADSAFGKLNAGIALKDSSGKWLESQTFSEFTDSSQISLTWIIPDRIKEAVSQDAEVQFNYFWSERQQITLDSVDVRYSYGSGGEVSGSLSDEAEIQVAYQNDDAQKIVNNIQVGWNLGNSLDCYDITWSVTDFETAWGNPKTTKQMIDTVKKAGFNAVRIPVSWTDHLDSDGNIDTLWLKRVQQVVDYAMDNQLYTILNMHHDDYTWLTPTYDKEEEVTEKYIHVWEQIADRFKNYDTTLLFEGLNEPRVVGSTDEWTGGTSEERDVINHLLQTFVDTVRHSGGNNSMRTLIITTEAASISDNALNGLVIPEDDNLILSIHHYAPWKFTSYEFKDVTEFTDEDKETLRQEFETLQSKFVSKGLPVIIGEFGAENKNNPEDRAEYYEYYIQTAKEYGIPCFIWDNNVSSGEGSYGLFNREECSWYYPEIIEAIQSAVK